MLFISPSACSDCQWFSRPSDWPGPPTVGGHPERYYEVTSLILLLSHTTSNTPEILRLIHSHLPSSPDSCMIWAACCLGFFGFLRAGEFTVPSAAEFNPEVHLSLADVVLDSHSSPSLMRVCIKQSRTDPFRQGVDIYLGKAPPPLFPYFHHGGLHRLQRPPARPSFPFQRWLFFVLAVASGLSL